MVFSVTLLGCICCCNCSVQPEEEKYEMEQNAEVLIYIGTYTGGDSASEGIYSAAFDLKTGALGAPVAVGRAESPSFLALHPSGPYLYAVNETARGEGGVSAFVIDDAGGLTFLNRQSSHGSSPCYVSVEHTGRYALVANYGSGTVAMLPIQSDGSLGPASAVVHHQGSSVHPQRQQGPHAHSVVVDPSNRFALVADLGLDRIMIYRLDLEAGKLVANDPPFAKVPAGSGPRHLAFHPNGRFLYCINELASTLTAFSWDGEQGVAVEIGSISTLPAGYDGTSYCADVHVAPSGRYVYGSNRGHDSIAIFAVDQETGAVTLVGHEGTRGSYPRNFCLTPDGNWLLAANQNTDDIYTFRVDKESGTLQATGHSLKVPRPVCILMASQ